MFVNVFRILINSILKSISYHKFLQTLKVSRQQPHPRPSTLARLGMGTSPARLSLLAPRSSLQPPPPPTTDHTTFSSSTSTVASTKPKPTMASLPPALDFPKTEEEICAKWAEEQTFKKQDELALERGDEVRSFSYCVVSTRLLLRFFLWWSMSVRCCACSACLLCAVCHAVDGSQSFSCCQHVMCTRQIHQHILT